ncbi:MAG: L-threonylcarbamoyladenylate synthase [Pseudomonadota bacterium]
MKTYETTTMQANSFGITQAVSALKEGYPVALPTETVYGLGADAFNLDAIQAVFAAKQRPQSDPLIVHVSSSSATLDSLASQEIIDRESITAVMAEVYEDLMQKFWPGPLTLLFPRGRKIDASVTSGQPYVAVRQPDHPVFLEILERLQRPIVAPSANLFGRISPTTAAHVYNQLEGRIRFIVDGGTCCVGVESTIIRVEEDGSLTLLRPGGVSVERIFSSTGLPVKSLETTTQEEAAPLAPGRLSKHYAPSKRTLMVTSVKDLMDIDFLLQVRAGILSTRPGSSLASDLIAAFPETAWTIESLPHDREGQAAAANIFSALHRLDALSLDLILVEAPDQCDHLWRATVDRLTRAASD